MLKQLYYGSMAVAAFGIALVCFHISLSWPQFQGMLTNQDFQMTQVAQAVIRASGSIQHTSGDISTYSYGIYQETAKAHDDIHRLIFYSGCGLFGLPRLRDGCDRVGSAYLIAYSIADALDLSDPNNQTGRTLKGIEDASLGLKELEDQWSALYPEFFDCQGLGPSCAQNRVFNILTATQYAMEAAQRSSEASAQGFPAIVKNTEEITANLNKLTRPENLIMRIAETIVRIGKWLLW